MDSPSKAVVLLSGGVDSSTTLAIARAEGYQLYALTFRYGQRHQFELEVVHGNAESCTGTNCKLALIGIVP